MKLFLGPGALGPGVKPAPAILASPVRAPVFEFWLLHFLFPVSTFPLCVSSHFFAHLQVFAEHLGLCSMLRCPADQVMPFPSLWSSTEVHIDKECCEGLQEKQSRVPRHRVVAASHQTVSQDIMALEGYTFLQEPPSLPILRLHHLLPQGHFHPAQNWMRVLARLCPALFLH